MRSYGIGLRQWNMSQATRQAVALAWWRRAGNTSDLAIATTDGWISSAGWIKNTVIIGQNRYY
jgi:hypothetical protein